MKNPLQWLADFFRGRAHRVLEGLEDPREQLGLFVNDLNEQLADLRRAVARALKDEKRLRLEIRDHLSKAADWERRAVLALEEGDDTLARSALVKKEDCDVQALTLQKDWEAHQDVADKLKDTLHAAKRQVDEARRKYTLSVARYESAQAQKSIADTLNSQASDSANELVEQLDDKIRQLEAETDVHMEMSAAGEDGSLESRFLELENRRKGNEALDQLKASLGDRRSLPPSSSRVEQLKAKLDQS